MSRVLNRRKGWRLKIFFSVAFQRSRFSWKKNAVENLLLGKSDFSSNEHSIIIALALYFDKILRVEVEKLWIIFTHYIYSKNGLLPSIEIVRELKRKQHEANCSDVSSVNKTTPVTTISDVQRLINHLKTWEEILSRSSYLYSCSLDWEF